MLLKGFPAVLHAVLHAVLLGQAAAWKIKREDNNSTSNSTSSGSAPDLSNIWDYEQDKIHGISLGGWLVLEPYITPSLFNQFGDNDEEIPVDEYTFTEKLGKDEAEKQLEEHWESYYTEDDFKDIKKYGFNLVRIPIGYWAFEVLEDDPYVQGQEKYLDLALGWARDNSLKVWVDLHGVPGSQNGFDNSGKRGAVEWLDNEESLEVSNNVLNYIFKKYSGLEYQDVIIGIEIVNEPLTPKLNETDLLDFYYNSYYDYRVTHGSENFFVAQEAFQPIGFWNDQFNNKYTNVSKTFLNSSISTDFYGVVIDHHHYEVFTVEQLRHSSNVRVQDIRNYAESIGATQKYHPSLVGEWSGAITDCAKWLNGVGTGARYDNTFNESQLIANSPENSSSKDLNLEDGQSERLTNGTNGTYGAYSAHFNSTFIKKQDEVKNCSKLLHFKDFTSEHKADIRKFVEIQLIEYEKNSAGWIFWNYKTEDAIEWDFKRLTDKGLFPLPFDDYKYFHSNGSAVVEEQDQSSNGSPIVTINFGMVVASILALALSL